MEDAVHDSRAMRSFIGIDLHVDAASDATALLKYRRLLDTHSFTKVMFDTINGHLAGKGLLHRKARLWMPRFLAVTPVERYSHNWNTRASMF